MTIWISDVTSTGNSWDCTRVSLIFLESGLPLLCPCCHRAMQLYITAMFLLNVKHFHLKRTWHESQVTWELKTSQKESDTLKQTLPPKKKKKKIFKSPSCQTTVRAMPSQILTRIVRLCQEATHLDWKLDLYDFNTYWSFYLWKYSDRIYWAPSIFEYFCMFVWTYKSFCSFGDKTFNRCLILVCQSLRACPQLCHSAKPKPPNCQPTHPLSFWLIYWGFLLRWM